jgi:DNA-binding CsgD family transcriptional regulator
VTAAIVGRGAHLDAVEALLDGDRLRALVIEGEAGIGKTTLWRRGVDMARERGLTVLAAQPAQTEATLAYAALGDLLEPLLDDSLERLPVTQRAALEIALQLRPATRPPDELAVARACVELVSGTTGPVLVAVDDVQWLDAASSRALEFTLRRLDVGTSVLLSRRSEQSLPAPLGLDRVHEPDRLESRRLGPLTIDELGELVHTRLGVTLLRPRLLELKEASGGNPFYALEIVRAADEDGALHVPESLGAALRERLSDLSPETRDAVLLAAASGRPTAALVERAAGSAAGLALAVEADVLGVDGERIRFTHPLIASVAYESALPWERRDAHRRLAAVAEGEERARHLALGSGEGPDAELAAELETSAASIAGHAPTTAAWVLEHAARLTPEDCGDDRRRRLSEAAQQHFLGGDHETSRAILLALTSEITSGRDRALVLSQLSQVAETEADGLALCREALAFTEGDVMLEADLHLRIAASARRVTTPGEAVDHAHRAVALSESGSDPARVAAALAMLGSSLAALGSPEAVPVLERAVDVDSRLTAPLRHRPGFLLGVQLTVEGDLAGARPLLREQLERATASGDEVMRAIALAASADLELRAGDWGRAHELAVQAVTLLAQAAPLQDQVFHSTAPGYVFAHVGQIERARAIAETNLASAHGSENRTAEIRARGLLCFVELSLGEHERAVEAAQPALSLLDATGVSALLMFTLIQDCVEALVALGDLDRAAHVNARVEHGWRARHVAIHARGRAQIAAARGDEREARQAITDALTALQDRVEPFELGRTLLVRGRFERRFKHRAAARAALGEALELFDVLGAPLWAEIASSELARIPGRARASGDLTETERRVAELVAQGLANKEVAARLHVTVRTVEANLTKIYAKLGVRSRTELANKLHE